MDTETFIIGAVLVGFALAVLRFAIQSIAESLGYGWHTGRLRAESEVASKALPAARARVQRSEEVEAMQAPLPQN